MIEQAAAQVIGVVGWIASRPPRGAGCSSATSPGEPMTAYRRRRGLILP